MRFRDLLAVIATPDADDAVLALAGQLAAQWTAQVSAVVIAWKPGLPAYPDSWGADHRYEHAIQRCRLQAETERRAIEARLERKVAWPRVETLLVLPDDTQDALAQRARLTDLVLVRRPEGGMLGDPHTPAIEGALLYSGRPVMVVPPDWTPRPLGRRVVVCWNGGREAARALADAMPIIEGADYVSAISVGAEAGHDGGDPLFQLAGHLERRGVPHEVRRLRGQGESVSETVRQHCADVGADLAVIGGYGRLRLAETVFGGVTRDMLASAELPVLMSH